MGRLAAPSLKQQAGTHTLTCDPPARPGHSQLPLLAHLAPCPVLLRATRVHARAFPLSVSARIAEMTTSKEVKTQIRSKNCGSPYDGDNQGACHSHHQNTPVKAWVATNTNHAHMGCGGCEFARNPAPHPTTPHTSENE